MEVSGEKEDEDGGAEESLPMMHWEDLSARIEELEKQERTIQGATLRAVWYEDQEEDKKRRLTSRFQKNLQLCFYNDGDSEDEGEAKGKASVCCGLKQEVVVTLRMLRDKRLDELRQENKEQTQVRSEGHPLVRSELEQRSLQELQGLRTSLQRDAHGLSAELVSVLLIRDQLRTEQEALLLDLLDLT